MFIIWTVYKIWNFLFLKHDPRTGLVPRVGSPGIRVGRIVSWREPGEPSSRSSSNCSEGVLNQSKLIYEIIKKTLFFTINFPPKMLFRKFLCWILMIPIAWPRYPLWALLIWGSLLNLFRYYSSGQSFLKPLTGYDYHVYIE